MRTLRSLPVQALSFSALFALLAACGGSQPPAQTPVAQAETTSDVGSATPDPTPSGASDPGSSATGSSETSTSATPGSPAASSTDNGSDIIPPFPSSAPGKKQPGGKSNKKVSGKSKKKG